MSQFDVYRSGDGDALLLDCQSGLLGQFVSITTSLCSEADAKRVESLFRPRLAELGMGELDLARPLGTIRQCAAIRAKRGAEVSAALAPAGR